MSAFSDAVNRTFRKFVRYTGDGLPGSPANADLPVGDPTTPLYNPPREEIRTTLLMLDGIAEAAASARDGAEAARDLAEDYAEAAVSASNVPIYSTRAFVLGFDVPTGINAFRTNGYATSGDGGAGFYVADATPGPGGISDGGTPTRTFKLASDEVSLVHFGGVTADLASYQAAQIAALRAVYSPAYHPARGLRISEFCTTTGAFVDQTERVQAAIDALIDSPRYFALDLEGVQVLLENSLVIDHAGVPSASRYPQAIRNGTLSASGPEWPGAATPILSMIHSGAGVIQAWNFENVNFRGAASGGFGLSSGVLIGGSYQSIRFFNCDFRNPAQYAIRTRPISGVDQGWTQQNLCAELCNIVSPHPSDMPFADRVLVSFDLWRDGDGKLLRNRSAYSRVALRGAIGSYLVNSNHFFQGRSDAGPHSGVNPVIQLGARPNSAFIGNYIDNGHIEFREGLNGDANTPTQGYCVFSGNIHTMLNTAASENMMVFRPVTSPINLAHLKIVNSQFRVFGDSAQTMTQPFRTDLTGGGYMQTAVCQNVDIKDNYFWGAVTPQSTHIRKRITTTTASMDYPISVDGYTPFNLQANYLTSTGVLMNAGTSIPPSVGYERISGYNGNIRISPATNGTIVAELNCNSSSQFD